jgi:hypothetical protein
MTQEEFELKKYAATNIVTIADEYLAKIKSNVAAIDEKRISVKSVNQALQEIIRVLSSLVHESKVSELDPAEKLTKVVEVLSSVVNSLESTMKSGNEEIIRLEATQVGMQRALEAVKGMGLSQVRELEKIDSLSNENPDDKSRSVGERPEKISVKRNAASLKKSRESEDS